MHLSILRDVISVGPVLRALSFDVLRVHFVLPPKVPPANVNSRAAGLAGGGRRAGLTLPPNNTA